MTDRINCPHCQLAVHWTWVDSSPFGDDPDGRQWVVFSATCPACGRIVLELSHLETEEQFRRRIVQSLGDRVPAPFPFSEMPTLGQPRPLYFRDLIWPRVSARPAAPPEVPEPIAEDYREACLVLEDSPKASAALSRRCLQAILKDAAGVKKRDLVDQIQEVLDSKALPTYLADALDSIRIVGNYAVHPTKSESTGEIVDVEPGEAENNLNTVLGLFDFYYVAPRRSEERRQALQQKLDAAGSKAEIRRSQP